jgi:GNAT superfamily N-acetyltransferase
VSALPVRLTPEALSWREEIRPADVLAIAALVQGTGFFTGHEIGIACELVDERLAKGPASGYFFLVAELADGIAGYACHGPTDADPAVFDLYWIAVRQDLRGRGLGRLVIERTEARIREMGGRRVLIETSSRDLYAPTRHFYERHGYALFEQIPDFYAPGDDCCIYAKDL